MSVVKSLGSLYAFAELGIHAVALTEQIFHASAISIIIYFLNVKNVPDSLKKEM